MDNEDRVFRIGMAYVSADAFFRVGKGLYDKLMRSIGEEAASTESFFTNVIPAAMNLTFSMELFIKFHLLQLDPYYSHPSGHNLLRLFKKLPDRVQNRINKTFLAGFDDMGEDAKTSIRIHYRKASTRSARGITSTTYQNIKAFLKYHEESFVIWRYMYDSITIEKELSVSLNGLLCAIEAVRYSIENAEYEDFGEAGPRNDVTIISPDFKVKIKL